MSSRPDAWDPAQYDRFAPERRQPFFDLLALLHPSEKPRVLDLGCGTGELTAMLHRHTGAASTVGVDRSPAMLAEAGRLAQDGLSFVEADLRDVQGLGPVDVVFSNAALQWVPDHPAVLASWAALLGSRGQLAVQVPANVDHASHRLSSAVANESPFIDALGGDPPADPVRSVLAPEEYAVLLHRLGFADQHVRLQVYAHRLASTADVVEWVKGTSLVRFRERLSPGLFAAFVARYRQRLLEELGDQRPYLYPFKRILMWGRRPSRVLS